MTLTLHTPAGSPALPVLMSALRANRYAARVAHGMKDRPGTFTLEEMKEDVRVTITLRDAKDSDLFKRLSVTERDGSVTTPFARSDSRSGK